MQSFQLWSANVCRLNYKSEFHREAKSIEWFADHHSGYLRIEPHVRAGTCPYVRCGEAGLLFPPGAHEPGNGVRGAFSSIHDHDAPGASRTRAHGGKDAV